MLDVSFNRIGKIEGLEGAGLASLQQLFLANNSISELGGLGNLPALRLLELGSNQIRTVPCLKARATAVAPQALAPHRRAPPAAHAARRRG